jgi:hypothetical protein
VVTTVNRAKSKRRLLHSLICLPELLQGLGGIRHRNREPRHCRSPCILLRNHTLLSIAFAVRVAVYDSTAAHTGHLHFKVLGAFVDAIGENVAIRVCLCFTAATRSGNRFIRVLGVLVVAIGDPIAVGICFYSPTASFACQSHCRVLRVFIVVIKNPVAVGVRSFFSTTQFVMSSIPMARTVCYLRGTIVHELRN